MDVLTQQVDRYTVEKSYSRAKKAQMSNTFGSSRYSELAFNHARNRDPRILQALERAANVMQQIWEEQLGNYSRSDQVAFFSHKKTCRSANVARSLSSSR